MRTTQIAQLLIEDRHLLDFNDAQVAGLLADVERQSGELPPAGFENLRAFYTTCKNHLNHLLQNRTANRR